jgi:hypothetical protein
VTHVAGQHRAAAIYSLEPVAAALFSHLVGGEPLLALDWLGGGLIVLGVVAGEVGGALHAQAPAEPSPYMPGPRSGRGALGKPWSSSVFVALQAPFARVFAVLPLACALLRGGRLSRRGTSMRRFEIGSVVALFAALVAQGCGSRSGEAAPHAQGATSFESPPPGAQGSRSGDANASTGGGAGGAPTAEGADAATAPRAIEEADVYKRVGTTLYVLNAYRGLQIVDLTDLAAPRLLSRVAVSGTPVDLYVRGTVAFVAVSDSFDYVVMADGATRPSRGSRLYAVDVSNPSRPAIVAELPLAGQLEETRIVGDILYVVSRNYYWYDWRMGVAPAGGGDVAVGVAVGSASSMPTSQQDTVFVASFDVRDPAHPQEKARLELPTNGWDAHANVTEERITLSFAGWGNDGPVTSFQIVDISDPAGALVAGATFSASGTVQDRWGMDFTAGVFRAVLAMGWNGGATLAIWSSPQPSGAEALSSLHLNVNESLTGARFDDQRAYIVTAFRSDPLWIVDTTDPAHPRRVSELAMPGQIEFIEPRGDRLLALGHSGEAGQPFQLTVSLIDTVTPKLVSRVLFGSAWSWVGAQPDDLRKAFIVIDEAGLILVPVQGWDQVAYKYAGGTQLVEFDLQSGLENALVLRGFLKHPGAVKRAFPVDAEAKRLAALSDSVLQTIDADDPGAPSEMAHIDLARSVEALALVRGKAVELCGDWYRGDMELVVTDAGDPDAATPLTRDDISAPYARMFQDGDVIWLMANDWNTGKAWLQAVDFADPANPVKRGYLEIAPEEGVGFSPGYVGNWGFGGEAVLVGHALAVHRSYYRGLMEVDCPAGGSCGTSSTDELRVYDLSNPNQPRLAATVTIPDSSWSWGLQAFGSHVWLTHFEWQQGAELGRYYVDRIDLSDPANPRIVAKVNVPGVLFAASDDGSRLYTLETIWRDTSSTTWLHSLELASSGTARLLGSAALDGYPAGAAQAGSFAWVVTSRWTGDRTASQLAAVDVGSMNVTSRQTVEGDWTWLRKAAGGKLFLQQSWRDQGILVYGLADPAHPAFERFVRTQGWVLDVVVGGGFAYLPSGPYGVPMVKIE